MAETTTIINEVAPGTAICYIGIEALSTATIELVAQDVSDDGLRKTADYVFKHGDPRYPLSARVSITRDPRAFAGSGMVKCSVRLNGFMKVVEDSTTPDTVLGIYPVTSVIAWDVPIAVLAEPWAIFRLLSKNFWLIHNGTKIYVAGDAEEAESFLLPGLSFFAPASINKVP